MKGVERQVLEWRKQTKVGRFNPMIEGATASANGAIADPYMIQIGVDLKLDFPAVTGAAVGLFHWIYACCWSRHGALPSIGQQ